MHRPPPIRSPEREQDRLLAAEYVLGTLEAAERAQVRQRMRAEPDFAHLVRQWEHRLNPLHELTAPIAPPPELWRAILADLPAVPAAKAQGSRPPEPGKSPEIARAQPGARPPAGGAPPGARPSSDPPAPPGAKAPPVLKPPGSLSPQAAAMLLEVAAPPGGGGSKAATKSPEVKPREGARPVPPAPPTPRPFRMLFSRSDSAPEQMEVASEAMVRALIGGAAATAPVLPADTTPKPPETRAEALKAVSEAVSEDWTKLIGALAEDAFEIVPKEERAAEAPTSEDVKTEPPEIDLQTSAAPDPLEPELISIAAGDPVPSAVPLLAQEIEAAVATPAAPAAAARRARKPGWLTARLKRALKGGPAVPDVEITLPTALVPPLPEPATVAPQPEAETPADAGPKVEAGRDTAAPQTELAASEPAGDVGAGSSAEAAATAGEAAAPLVPAAVEATSPEDAAQPDAAVAAELDAPEQAAAPEAHEGPAIDQAAGAPDAVAPEAGVLEAGVPEPAALEADDRGVIIQEALAQDAGVQDAGVQDAMADAPTAQDVMPQDTAGHDAGTEAAGAVEVAAEQAAIPEECAQGVVAEAPSGQAEAPDRASGDLELALDGDAATPDLGQVEAAAGEGGAAEVDPAHAGPVENEVREQGSAPAEAAQAGPAEPDVPCPGDALRAVLAQETGTSEPSTSDPSDVAATDVAAPAPEIPAATAPADIPPAVPTPASEPDPAPLVPELPEAPEAAFAAPAIASPPAAASPEPGAVWRVSAIMLGVLAVSLLGLIAYREWFWPRQGSYVALLEAAPAPAVTLRIDPVSGVVFARALAAEPPEGKVYHLWLVRPEGGVVRLGRFSSGMAARSQEVLQLSQETLRSAEVNITLEAAGADTATTPQGPVIFAGHLVPE